MSKVLPQDTMVVLLTELQLADGAVNILGRRGKPAEDYAKSFTKQILDKHGVSSEDFEESMRYYSYYVKKMNAILGS